MNSITHLETSFLPALLKCRFSPSQLHLITKILNFRARGWGGEYYNCSYFVLTFLVSLTLPHLVYAQKDGHTCTDQTTTELGEITKDGVTMAVCTNLPPPDVFAQRSSFSLPSHVICLSAPNPVSASPFRLAPFPTLNLLKTDNFFFNLFTIL